MVISRGVMLVTVVAGVAGVGYSSPARAQAVAPRDGDPPAADAAQKVAPADAAARAAQLTPIVPDPNGLAPPAFQLYAEIDIPVLTVGLVFVGVRFVQTPRDLCPGQAHCDPGPLNALDRTTAGFWNPNWLLASNVGLIAEAAGALALLADEEGGRRAANDAVVVAESALSATAVATIMTIAAGRPRPFVYGDKAPLADRTGSDAANSFLSSHAAVAFAIATSTYMTMHRLRPASQRPVATLALGLGAAAFVATSRVLAGQHFITDALGGALVGSSVGVVVSSFHGSPVSVVPVAGEHHQGIGVRTAF
jgi:membrane-associated phospholipid phosphatase